MSKLICPSKHELGQINSKYVRMIPAHWVQRKCAVSGIRGGRKQESKEWNLRMWIPHQSVGATGFPVSA